MLFQWRGFCFPKDVDFPQQNMDAFAVDPESGIAAVTDGAASGSYSGPWAEIIVTAAIEDQPDFCNGGTLHNWLDKRREIWREQIPPLSSLDFFQREKLRLYGGGHTTLVWISLTRQDVQVDEEDVFTESYRLQGYAIGDSCLLHVRADRLLSSFPIEDISDFSKDPATIESIDRQQDCELPFQAFETECQPGDLVVLCTDAFAAWALQRIQSGQMIDWDDLWAMSDQEFGEQISTLRQIDEIRVDDTTLLLMSIPTAADIEQSESPLSSTMVATNDTSYGTDIDTATAAAAEAADIADEEPAAVETQEEVTYTVPLIVDFEEENCDVANSLNMPSVAVRDQSDSFESDGADQRESKEDQLLESEVNGSNSAEQSVYPEAGSESNHHESAGRETDAEYDCNI